MQTFVNVFLGFFIFKSVVAAPISDTIIYDSEFYDIPLGELPHPFAHDENKQTDQVEASSIRRTSVPFPLFPKPSFDLSPSPFLVKLSTVSAADGNIVYLSAQKDKTDIGTKLLSVIQESYSSAPLTEETEDEASTPKLIDGSSAQGSGVLGPQTQDESILTPPPKSDRCLVKRSPYYFTVKTTVPLVPEDLQLENLLMVGNATSLPTCLLCTCLGTTVYCDDRELHTVPPLPRKTTYFYSRYNRIKKISRNDFANLNHLKRIDLTANFISDIHKDAFRRLPQLQELVLRDNRIRQLPELPSTLTFIDVSKNRLGRRGIPNEAFKNLDELKHLYITDNNLDHIPLPLPESLQALHLQNNNIQEMHEDTFCKRRDFTYVRRALEDIRLDGNPINLSKTPYAYMCLPRLPVGNLI